MNIVNSPIRVVLVDDAVVVRERIASFLSVLVGVEVVGQAGDALAGLALVHEHQPDVLVLDIGLPGQSGIELLEVVKQLKPSPLVIMLTNYDDAKLREKCLQLGADFYFHKPAEFEKTLDVCQELAAIRAHVIAAAKKSLGYPDQDPS